LQVGVVQQQRGFPWRRIIVFQIVCIESARPQRAFDGAPSGWRMAMVHVSGRAAKSFFAKLAFEGMRWEIGVGLARAQSFDARKAYPFTHGQSTPLSI
jgi:hypothetical protein